MKNTGTLYITACPIGNYEDITLRALRILKDEVDIIYCEDTRQTGTLLSKLSFKKPLRSLHAHSHDKKIAQLIDELKNNKNIAYMTDCGTPGLSDPGSKIVKRAREEGLTITPLPGVSALTTLVSMSGFSQSEIIFAGFLSKKPGKRLNELNRLQEFQGTIVIYESPHRIEKTLIDIGKVFQKSEVVIGREMTKIWEEFIHTSGEEIPNIVSKITAKGEFAISINNSGIKIKN